MRRLAFDFTGNLPEPTAQGGKVPFPLLSAWLIAAKIERKLKIVLGFQVLLNSSL